MDVDDIDLEMLTKNVKKRRKAISDRPFVRKKNVGQQELDQVREGPQVQDLHVSEDKDEADGDQSPANEANMDVPDQHQPVDDQGSVVRDFASKSHEKEFGVDEEDGPHNVLMDNASQNNTHSEEVNSSRGIHEQVNDLVWTVTSCVPIMELEQPLNVDTSGCGFRGSKYTLTNDDASFNEFADANDNFVDVNVSEGRSGLDNNHGNAGISDNAVLKKTDNAVLKILCEVKGVGNENSGEMVEGNDNDGMVEGKTNHVGNEIGARSVEGNIDDTGGVGEGKKAASGAQQNGAQNGAGIGDLSAPNAVRLTEGHGTIGTDNVRIESNEVSNESEINEVPYESEEEPTTPINQRTVIQMEMLRRKVERSRRQRKVVGPPTLPVDYVIHWRPKYIRRFREPLVQYVMDHSSSHGRVRNLETDIA
ncbi:uncharacterized protein LOC110713356 isoform X2 [Chenopodium quinoa]|uniref:uncharacterized protein LOC110713356 isoform X2 n=1 Tax=Chenopodium quinoa TaxID=63459 RepID=UPI000B79359B|nr:uncharacterized protein LOC110713356 isoform X2 [Chenopodium quinoa]